MRDLGIVALNEIEGLILKEWNSNELKCSYKEKNKSLIFTPRSES